MLNLILSYYQYLNFLNKIWLSSNIKIQVSPASLIILKLDYL